MLAQPPQLSGLNTRGIGWQLLTAHCFGSPSCVGLNHRPQFAGLQTERGCIDRLLAEALPRRSGVFSLVTPLRIEKPRKPPKVVQPPRPTRTRNCGRSMRPVRNWLRPANSNYFHSFGTQGLPSSLRPDVILYDNVECDCGLLNTETVHTKKMYNSCGKR